MARGSRTQSISGADPLQRRQLEHLSYSAKNTLDTCGKQLELTRLLSGVPKRPAVWLAGGNGVHGCTEDWDRAQLTGARFDPAASWRQRFGEALDRLKAEDPDLRNWRQSKSEGVAQWMTLGPKLCIAYFKWRRETRWPLWITPDGEPAIELDTSGMLPGCPIEVMSFPDRVFRLPSGQLFLVDIKTGTRQPDNPLQFGTYAAAIAAKYPGTTVPSGAPFMNRKGALGTVMDLSIYTPQYMGAQFGRAHAQIEQGLLNANPGSHCFFCDVSTSCYARGGALAVTFDRDHPANAAPF